MRPKRLSTLVLLALLLLLLCSSAVHADQSESESQATVGVLGSGVALIVFFVCLGLSVLFSLCITIYLAYFMYTDANARGENGVLWMVIGIFGGLLGLLVWLIIRPEKKPRPETVAPQ